MATAASEPQPAEIAYAGKWSVKAIESEATANFTLRYPPSASSASLPIALADLGLAPETFSGPKRPVRFELRREAGAFVCSGTAGSSGGDGPFRFTPDTAYAAAVAATGLVPLTLQELVKAGMFDLSSSFVKEVVATGFPHATFQQLVALKMFGVTREAVRAMNADFPKADASDIAQAKIVTRRQPVDFLTLHSDFPSASLDGIVALTAVGVTPEFVEALRRAGVGELSAENVAALRAAGVDRAFVENLIANGPRGLSIDEVADLHQRDQSA